MGGKLLERSLCIKKVCTCFTEVLVCSGLLLISGKYRNQYYQKAIEKKEKREREDKRLKERLLAQRAAAPARRPYNGGGYRGRGASHYHSSYRRPDERHQDRPAAYHAQGNGERIKCYNCQGFGHLARDCFNKPAAAGGPPK